MNEYATTIIRKLTSPSMRFELREAAARLRELLGRTCLWRWEITRFPLQGKSPYDILYIGRESRRELIQILFGIKKEDGAGQAKTNPSGQTVIVSELPIPGALCVPQYLRAIVPLKRPLVDITSGFSYEFRRVIRQHRSRYRMLQAMDDAEIDHADREMLQPYATARHGNEASQIDSDEVRRIALKDGRLELVLSEKIVVGCNLGCVIIRTGKRYWSLIRVGYPEAIFSDTKQLHKTNSLNFYFALEWALENGFDYFDMGNCLGRPEDGLLQWKKRLGGKLNLMGNYGYFHVRLPKTGTAQFLWENPLFAVDHDNLSLHLGLPDGQSDEDIATRYRKMGFGGLSKIYLHCAKVPDESLLNKLRSLYNHYKHQNPPPTLEIIPSNPIGSEYMQNSN